MHNEDHASGGIYADPVCHFVCGTWWSGYSTKYSYGKTVEKKSVVPEKCHVSASWEKQKFLLNRIRRIKQIVSVQNINKKHQPWMKKENLDIWSITNLYYSLKFNLKLERILNKYSHLKIKLLSIIFWEFILSNGAITLAQMPFRLLFYTKVVWFYETGRTFLRIGFLLYITECFPLPYRLLSEYFQNAFRIVRIITAYWFRNVSLLNAFRMLSEWLQSTANWV